MNLFLTGVKEIIILILVKTVERVYSRFLHRDITIWERDRSLPSYCFNPPPAFSSALKSNSHGVCSDSLFIKEMNSICIIHFFCDFFPLQGVNAPQCIGNRDSDRRRREQGGKNAFPHVAGTDRGQEVWPLLADTLSSTIPSRQKEGAPCAGY